MTPSPAPSERRLLRRCPICESERLYYAFSHQRYRVVRCGGCSLLLLNPQPSDDELTAIYGARYFLGDDSPEGLVRVAEMKAATARFYLGEIERYRGPGTGRLLEVGCGSGDFLIEARKAGYDVRGVEISPAAAARANERLGGDRVTQGELEGLEPEDGGFDVCVLSDVLEHFRDPTSSVAKVHALLKPGGTLFIATPSVASWSARLLRQSWMEFKPEHLTYFDDKTVQDLLFRAGFREVIVEPGRKVLSFEYVAHHLERFPVPLFTPVSRALSRLAPRRLREWNVRVVASGILVFARSAEPSARRKLSVIVPAFNEASTFEVLMESLLRKTLEGLDVEIVVVESNSTDGTREIALRYADRPRVKVVLEERPRGKGHAVRTGLAHATGDFVMIQDADLEYDLEDYDVLIEPLRSGREAFVLGSRHGGSAWKMRRFTKQRLLSLGLNLGHWFFTTLLNVLFGQRLRDPFTMFKAFRRDCLYGLHFECDRFDFDFELLIKLVRKGYRPIEIPVNYRSRSFKEGKKVSVLRDPLTWIRALVRLRLASISPMREIERLRSDGNG